MKWRPTTEPPDDGDIRFAACRQLRDRRAYYGHADWYPDGRGWYLGGQLPATGWADSIQYASEWLDEGCNNERT